MIKCVHFGLGIIKTDLPKKAQKVRTRKTIGAECGLHSFAVTDLRQK